MEQRAKGGRRDGVEDVEVGGAVALQKVPQRVHEVLHHLLYDIDKSDKEAVRWREEGVVTRKSAIGDTYRERAIARTEQTSREHAPSRIYMLCFAS